MGSLASSKPASHLLFSPAMSEKERWRCMRFWYFVHGTGSPELRVYWRSTVDSTVNRTKIWEAWQKEHKWIYVQLAVNFGTSFQVYTTYSCNLLKINNFHMLNK